MKEKLVDALVNLLKVASIISLAAVVVFMVKSLDGTLDTAYIKEILMLVFVFYFGTKSGKQQVQDAVDELSSKLSASTQTAYLLPAASQEEDENEHFDSGISTTAIGFEIEDPELEYREDEPEE